MAVLPHRKRWKRNARALWLLLPFATAMAAGRPPGCERGDCGIRQPAAYEHIVIGHLRHVATDAEMSKLHRWARNGPWKELADDEADYLKRNRVFLMTADERGTPVMLHMSHEEYRRVTFHPGDLVRYTPRMAGHDGSDQGIYSILAGCMAILCRSEDSACMERYRPGTFRRTDGLQLDFESGRATAGGIVIDPLSLLPKNGNAAQKTP